MRLRSTVSALFVLAIGGGLLGAACDEDEPYNNCSGSCIPEGIDGQYQIHRIVWFGKPTEAPRCESVGQRFLEDLYGDLKDTARCPSCRCDARPCVLPPGLALRDSFEPVLGDCQMPEPRGNFTTAELPPEWDGSCVPASPYARRNYVGRLDLYGADERAESCRPSMAPEDLDASWGTFARLCEADIDGPECPGSCVATLPEGGFRYCVVRETDDAGNASPCPSSYPDRFELYKEMAGCAQCTCKELTPRTCEMTLSAYKDEECKDLLTTSDVVTRSVVDFQQCLDLPDGFDVRGLTGTVEKEERATCEWWGGAQIGTIGGGKPEVLCCAPPPPGN